MAPEPDNKWLSPEMQLPILRDKSLIQNGSGSNGAPQGEYGPVGGQEDVESTIPKDQLPQNSLSGAVVAPVELPQFELPHFDRVDQGGDGTGGGKKFAILGGIGGALLIIILLVVLLSGGGSPSSNTTATTTPASTTLPTAGTNTTLKTNTTTIATLPGSTTQPVATTTATTSAPGSTTSPQPVVTTNPPPNTTNPPPATTTTVLTTTTNPVVLPFSDTITMKPGSMTASSYSVGNQGGRFIFSNQTSSTQTVYVNGQGYSVPANYSGQASVGPAGSYAISATPLGLNITISVN